MADLKKRSEIHWARKIWHIVGVCIILVVYSYTPLWLARVLMALVWLLFVPADFARQKSQALNEFLLHLFKPFMREYEADGLAGTTFLLTGSALVVFVCPREVTMLALLFLAFADPFASYFGIRYGKDKIFGHKSVQGTIAAFLICTLAMVLFMYAHNLLLDRLVMVGLLGGLIGALAELIPVGRLDDNLTLPVFSATFLWLLFSLFGAI